MASLLNIWNRNRSINQINRRRRSDHHHHKLNEFPGKFRKVPCTFKSCPPPLSLRTVGLLLLLLLLWFVLCCVSCEPTCRGSAPAPVVRKGRTKKNDDDHGDHGFYWGVITAPFFIIPIMEYSTTYLSILLPCTYLPPSCLYLFGVTTTAACC